MSAIDYKALAERLRKHADRLDETREALGVLVGTADDPAADLRTVVSLLNGMAEEKSVAWVEVANAYEGPYSFHGQELLPTGRHSLFTHPAPQPLPEGRKLLKDSTREERSWPEDYEHENGNYSCTCHHCGREFNGHKRRVTCKVCAAAPQPQPQPQPKCWCRACLTPAERLCTFVVCPTCGNKRCPKADDHRNACSNSNALGQVPQPERQPVSEWKTPLSIDGKQPGSEQTEAQIEYEILCNDEWVASASGPGAEAEILHYLTQYEQDGPCEVYAVTRRLVDRAALAAKQPEPIEAQIEASQAALDVLAERRRQVEAEGWTPAHDDKHIGGQMAMAAACYAAHAAVDECIHCTSEDTLPSLAVLLARAQGFVAQCWPWSHRWWKPSDRRRNLVKAGALILAEIERLDRAALAAKEQPK